MIKITYIIDDLQVGGAQTHLLTLANALSSEQFLVEIICLGHIDQMLVARYPRLKINAVTMHSIRKINFWKGFINLVAVFKEKRPNIVHTYLSTSNVFGVIAAKMAKVPIVLSSRRDMGHFRSNLIGKLEIFTAHLCNKIVCVSKAAQERAIKSERIAKEKTVVIYNGVDLNRFSNLKTENRKLITGDSRIVGMIATMNRAMKGHKEFIEVAALVAKDIPNVKFLLIGDGFLRKKLESAIRDAHDAIRDKVLFLGNRNDIPELLSIMDVLINASYSEGMSNTILESMAAGVPVVATAVDGNLETVKSLQLDYTPACRQAGITKLDYTDEKHATGILVPPKDPQAMAQAIIKILKDKDLATKMGDNARRLVSEKFSLQQMVKNYCTVYNQLFSSKNLSFASIQNSPAKDPEHSEGRQSATETSAVIRDQSSPRKSASNIGYIVSLFPCWSETFILSELVELKKRSIEPTIFSIRKDLEEFTQEKAKQFLKNTRYPESWGIFKSFLFWTFRRPFTIISFFWLVMNKKYSNLKVLFKNIWSILVGCYFATIVKKENIKHLQAHFATYPTLVALVISRLTKIPYTFTIHAHDIFLEKALLREKANFAKAVVAISDYNKQYLNNICQNGVVEKTKVIHCGLDLTEFSKLNSRHKENVILSIGRLTKMKGFEYLIKACSQIKNRVPIQCRIIGDGPLRDELERLIIKLGVRDSVRLEGVTDNNKIKQLLQESAVFVMPSVWDEQDGQDGIPMVLMEAMAAGVPVLASNISGIPELVEDGKTGLLVEPGNVEQLSQKILQLLCDKELQSRLSAAGRRKVEKEFDVRRSVEKLIQVFNS